MALVATIKCTRVYSDKQMTDVKNSRIVFADGSWRDVKTGEVYTPALTTSASGGDITALKVGA